MAAKAKTKRETKRKSSHGGPRPNSGRKPAPAKVIRKEILDAQAVEPDLLPRLEQALQGLAPQCLMNMVRLANGGFETIETTLAPAGSVTVTVPLMVPLRERGELVVGADGNPVLAPQLDMHGNPALVERLAFPDLPPEELVVVKRTSAVAQPDIRANTWLLEQVMGKARQKVEHTGKDGAPIPLVLYLPDNGRDPAPDAPAQLPAPGTLPVDAG